VKIVWFVRKTVVGTFRACLAVGTEYATKPMERIQKIAQEIVEIGHQLVIN
jgi:hypothetical protein